MQIEIIIDEYNNWEIANTDFNYHYGKDLAEVRLVSNGYVGKMLGDQQMRVTVC